MHAKPVSFDPPATVGPELSDNGATVNSPYGNLPDKFGPVLGSETAATGRVIWSFTMTGTNHTGQIVVGAADASVPLTAKSGPPCTGFHLGRSKIIHSKNSHKVSSSGGRTLSEDTPRKIAGSADSLIVFVIADMDKRRLSFAVGEQTPVDCGVRLPACGVRPWVWLGGPGVGSVSLAEQVLEAPSSPSTPSSTGTPFTSNRVPIGGYDTPMGPDADTMSEHSSETPTEIGDSSLAPTTLKLDKVDSAKKAEDEEMNMKQWTDRGASWFAGLFGGGEEKKGDAEKVAQVM